jgi:hypothetical protein
MYKKPALRLVISKEIKKIEKRTYLKLRRVRHMDKCNCFKERKRNKDLNDL